METFDHWEHEANWHVYAYQRRVAIEKATDKILRYERMRPSIDDDEFREVEPWQTFPLFNFLR